MTQVSSLTPTQQTVAIATAGMLVLVVLVLVYRGRLREDYAALWLVASVLALTLAVWQDGLRAIARLFDSVTLTAPVFLLAIAFLSLVVLRITVRLSDHDRRVRKLAQELSLAASKADRAGDDGPTSTLPDTGDRAG